MDRSTRWGFWGCAVALALASGCGCGGPTAEPRQCEVDPDRVAERAACVRDETCPCGSHCELGECVAACGGDGDCAAGEVCDLFGRCAPQGAPLFASVSRAPEGGLLLAPPVVEVTGKTPRAVAIRADRQALGPIRVKAEAGAEVRCDDAGAFQQECRFPSLALGSELRLLVRQSSGVVGETGTIRVYSGSRRASSSVTVVRPEGSPRILVTGPLEGTYRGRAVQQTSGLGPSTDGGQVAQTPMELDLDAHVYGDQSVAVLDLRDPLGVLGASGSWVADLHLHPDPATLRFPVTSYLRADAVWDAGVDLLLAGEVADLALTSAGGVTALAFSLTTSHPGLALGPDGGYGADTPFARWQIHLERTGALPAGAVRPTVPADATLARPAATAAAPTAWEVAARTALTPGALTVTDLTNAYGRRLYDLGACALSAPALASLVQNAQVAQYPFGTNVDANGVDVLATSSTNNPFRLGLDTGDLCSQFGAAAGCLVSGDATLTLAGTVGAPLATYQTVSGELVPYAVPCRLALSRVTRPLARTSGTAGPASLTLAFADVDRCVQVSTTLGCELVDVDPNAAGNLHTFNLTGASLQLTVAKFGGSGPTTWSDGSLPAAVSVPVARVCRFPAAPAGCAESALCFDTQRSPLASAQLTNTGASVPTFDALCQGATTLGARLPLDVFSMGAGAAANACGADLDRLRTRPPASVAAGGAGLDAVWNSGAPCIDAARYVFALGAALDQARDSVLLRYDPVPEARATALAHRLLQRWVDVHGFLAHQRQQAETLAAVVGPSQVPDIDLVLEESLAGWDLLLAPRFATALLGLPGSTLAVPDYRVRLGGLVPTDGAAQRAGLPVALLDALARQLLLVRARVERARFALEEEGATLATAGAVLRHALVVEALASELYRRARVASPGTSGPAWREEYDRARVAYGSALRQVRDTVRALRERSNPLGIEEEDLPLYFSTAIATADGRFAAMTDYLLGGPSSSGPSVYKYLGQAEAAMTGARSAWLAMNDRTVQRARDVAAQNLDLARVRQEYGDKVATYCGTPSTMPDTTAVLEGWRQYAGRDFDVANCYVREKSQCSSLQTQAYKDILTADDVDYRACIYDEIRAEMGASITYSATDSLKYSTASTYQMCREGFGRLTLGEAQGFLCGCSAYDVAVRLPGCECSADRTVCTPEYGNPDAGTPSTTFECAVCFSDMMAGFEPCRSGALPPSRDCARMPTYYLGAPAMGSLELPGSLREMAERICAARYPDAGSLAPPAPPDPDALNCFRGSLGEATLTLRAAAKDIEIARQELDDFGDSYDIQMRSCIIQQLGNEEAAELQAQHNVTITALRAVKLGADILGQSAVMVKDCSNSVAQTGSLWSAGATAAVACGSALVETGAKILSMSMQTAMDQTQQDHEVVMTALANRISDDRCFNDAELALVGARAAALRLDRARVDLTTALYRFQELGLSAEAAYVDGRNALALQKASFVTPLAGDFWLDQALSSYDGSWRIARRLTYLAARAVEYEFQQSRTERAQVLKARTPAELRPVVDSLLLTAGERRVEGKAPESFKVVLSLKQQLLQLADKGPGGGSKGLTATQRFQALLSDPAYRVHDAAGTYLGQRIPFDISPLGALGLGDPLRLGIDTGRECAERLWSVNAALIGVSEGGKDGGVVAGDAPGFVKIELHKTNTFSSQWCATGAETPFQSASVRPSHSLLREPGVAASSGLGSTSASTTNYSVAAIEAPLNVGRAEFSTDAYLNGASSQLAGRGLYGTYALFLPASVLAADERDPKSPGVHLNNLDDVLLRLDYVSVAR